MHFVGSDSESCPQTEDQGLYQLSYLQGPVGLFLPEGLEGSWLEGGLQNWNDSQKSGDLEKDSHSYLKQAQSVVENTIVEDQ